ncbi:MAG: ABC transporter ATP-binding protein [Pseudomonadota bacterium]
MLSVRNLEAGYGRSRVLFGVDLDIAAGEVVALLGRNGMGKTTTVHTLMGIVRPTAGSITFDEAELAGAASFRIAQAGLGLVPEGRQIFPNLTVHENLVATAANRRATTAPWTEQRVIDLFPILGERIDAMGTLLSGGEQQMLAIARALMTNPRLLILDEATEGLAPLVRDEIWACLRRLKDEGLSILVVDKNLTDLLALADRHVIIEKGERVWAGTSAELTAQPQVQSRYLGV